MNIKKLGKFVITAALIGVVAAGLAGCSKKDSAAAGDGGKKKVVNVAYTNYYVPMISSMTRGKPTVLKWQS